MEMEIPKENSLNSNLNLIPINPIIGANLIPINTEQPTVNTKNGSKSGETVPYILNGELYEIIERNGENVTVKCRSCPSGRFYRGSVRSTGNFHMHIKRRHSSLLGKLHEMKVHSLLERRDRLLTNRKAKLRRILVNNGTRDEHELHKLKIRRAFQRHQAEARGYETEPPREANPVAAETKPVINESTTEKFLDCNCNNITAEQSKEPTSTDNALIVPPPNSDFVSSENLLVNLQMSNEEQVVTATANTVPSQHTTPAATPNPSTYDGSTFGEFHPLPYSQLKNDPNEQRPLDLSFTARSRSPSPAIYSNASSGIGFEPMWSNTTVANTVSSIMPTVTTINHNSSLECSEVGVGWWQQRLALILCDIHNDIRARNRIEHNRLLLEIAKLKFLHPGFSFNLQN